MSITVRYTKINNNIESVIKFDSVEKTGKNSINGVVLAMNYATNIAFNNDKKIIRTFVGGVPISILERGRDF